jgi:hypothetical protein
MEYTITGKTPDKLEEKLALYKKLTALRDDLTERLGKAAAAKGSVSSKIFEKVKTEYSGKLENVHAQLSPIQSKLEREKMACEELLPRLEEEIRVLEDELAEAEFRFRVGEFDQNKLTEIQTRLNPDLAEKSERQTEVSARLKAIDAHIDVTAPEDDTAEFTESVEPEEKQDKQDEKESATDDASSSRVTLSSDDPLEALTEKPADKTTAEPADTNDGDESKNKPAAASSPAEESKEEAKDAFFENPQEWINELGEVDGKSGAKSATKTAENKPKTGSTHEKDKDDPLSALADPSGDPGDATETAADADAEPEEVSVSFPNMVIITGPGSGKKIPLLPMTMSIGREHDNNIELKDPDVGRYHARILYDRGRFVLEDLESSNGTWLNGEKISEAALKNGDRIKIGETELAIDFD